MNYLKIYCKLMRKAQKRNLENQIYVERHHIFPISIFGDNKVTVTLTYKEHFLAHRLLAKIYKKRYGSNDIRTRQMQMAIHRMVYTTNIPGVEHSARDYVIARKCVIAAKRGKTRQDMIGKKYFGASDETIKIGIEKMRLKKLGQVAWNKGKKHEYNLPHNDEWNKRIAASRQKTAHKYLNMTEDELWDWIYKQQKYRTQKNSNKKCVNPNVTRAMIIKKIPLSTYYDITDFHLGWIDKPGNKEKFYGL